MSERDKLIAPVEEPWCYGVESSHSGDVVVRETFDDEETALLHAHMNGGIVVPLFALRALAAAQQDPVGEPVATTYDAIADAVNAVAEAAQATFRQVGLEPGEWDGDDIVKDVSRGIHQDILNLVCQERERAMLRPQASAPAAPTDDLDALVAALGYQKQIDEDGTFVSVSRQAVCEAAQAITDLRAEVERAKTQRAEAWKAFTRLRRAYSMVRYPTLTEELRLLYDTADAVAARGKHE